MQLVYLPANYHPLVFNGNILTRVLWFVRKKRVYVQLKHTVFNLPPLCLRELFFF
uniref:Uncharacterized protein n=1 Tax=uncultured marine virus TaxID=186617 RepID=A0A0F7L3X4_9VIRU|nr:hypothetical protein [uncultured marine virus]